MTRSEVTEYMKSGRPFSCRVVRFNRAKKSGGQVKYYPEAVLVQKVYDDQLLGRPLTRQELEANEKHQTASKDHAHRKNHTRNIRILQSGRPTSIIEKIHTPLIVEFNGSEVF